MLSIQKCWYCLVHTFIIYHGIFICFFPQIVGNKANCVLEIVQICLKHFEFVNTVQQEDVFLNRIPPEKRTKSSSS